MNQDSIIENTEATPKLNLIPYNTGMSFIKLPEYGRTIQEMALKCCEIEDREQRTECAASIVEIMKTLFKDKNKEQDDKKFWDHLHIMTDFRLDVEGPYPVPDKEQLSSKPAKIPYPATKFSRRHYGVNIQKMIDRIAAMENCEEKDILVEMAANHLKKLQTLQNKDSADNARAFQDLAEFSSGRIVLSEDTYPLADFREDPSAKSQSRSKKKKSIPDII